MSISSVTGSAAITRSSVLSGLSSSSYCSVCGKASSVTSGVYASYGGRVGSDTYVCETCGKTLTSQKNSASTTRSNSLYSATGIKSSGYCPSCNSSLPSTASWTGAVAKTPAVSASTAAKTTTGTSYGSVAAWAK